MRKAGVIAMGAGLICAMVGACALDGPDGFKGAVVVVAGLFVAAIGNILIAAGKARETREAAARLEAERHRSETFRKWTMLKIGRYA